MVGPSSPSSLLKLFLSLCTVDDETVLMLILTLTCNCRVVGVS